MNKLFILDENTYQKLCLKSFSERIQASRKPFLKDFFPCEYQTIGICGL
jgi:hypothetical protein